MRCARCGRGSRGSVLCFLPGAPEIRAPHGERRARGAGRGGRRPVRRAQRRRAGSRGPRRPSGGRRRVILATNIAETSLTVPGVDTVVDTGLHKVARYDATRPSTRSTPSACPRPAPTSGPAAPPASGRDAPAGCGTRATGCAPMASRTSRASIWPGRCSTLAAWGPIPTRSPGSRRRRRRPWPRPAGCCSASAPLDGARADAARPADAGPAAAAAAGPHPDRGGRRPRRGAGLRDPLGAPAGAGSPRGDDVRPPRLAGRVGSRCRRTCTRWHARSRTWRRGSPPPRRARAVRPKRTCGGRCSSAIADRLARRREPQGTTLVLATGTGAVLGRESGVRDGEFLVALDVQAPTRPGDPNALVRVASRVEPEWIVPTAIAVEHAFDHRTGRVRAWRRERFDRLVLAEHAQAPEPAGRGGCAGGGVAGAGPRRDQRRLAPPRPVRRPRGRCVRRSSRQAAGGVSSLADIDLAAHAPYAMARELDRLAPTHLDLPSGRRTALAYEADGTVSASARLQELFGLAETPRVGPSGAPVVLSLLAPNGRPVQTTRDLRSFWDRTYPGGPARAARPVSAASRGPRIRGPRRPRREPSRGRVPSRPPRVGSTKHRPGHQSFANAGPSNRLRVRPARAGRRGRPYRGPDLVQCQPANRVRTGR